MFLCFNMAQKKEEKKKKHKYLIKQFQWKQVNILIQNRFVKRYQLRIFFSKLVLTKIYYLKVINTFKIKRKKKLTEKCLCQLNLIAGGI